MRIGQQRRQQYKPSIGIYIGPTQVKLLELTGKPDNMQIASYASASLPVNAVSEHQIINAEAVGQAIARAIKQSGTKNRNAAIGVAGSAVISKTITMAAHLTDAQLEEQIHIDAQQHIPYPLENVSLDFQVLGPDTNNPELNRILLVACRRDNVEMRTAVLETAKLTPLLVDVEEFALRNACTLLHDQMPNKGHGSTVAIFDMGSQQTSLNVLDDRHNVYSQEVPFGGESLAEELVNLRGLDSTEQLSAQLREGRIKAIDLTLPLGTFCDQAAQQIENTLDFYFSTEAENDNIDQILLTGSCTQYPDFEAQMDQRLPWPVACANPLRGINASRNARQNHVEHEGPSLMTAAGLSMRSIM